MTKEVVYHSVKDKTFLAQIGNRENPSTGAINVPVHFSTTYAHPGIGESTGYDYTRTKNPTREVLEKALAHFEEGSRGFATSSGMSAIQLIFNHFPTGSKFVASRDLYGGSFRYFEALERKQGFEFKYALEEEEFYPLITEETTAVLIETPSNPLMKVASIEKLAAYTHKHGALLIVDNTFYTPLIQKPLALGADIVIHSATKYLGGHNDVLAGAVIVKDEKLGEEFAFELNTTGAVLDPFSSWLLIRGLKTLGIRMKAHEENARILVEFLESSPQVKEVLYPGRGGMISFKVKDKTQINLILSSLKVFTFAESLGGVESLITYPVIQTHGDIPKEVRESYGLTDDLLRISTGIEDGYDLVEDLRRAFAEIPIEK